MIPKSPLLSSAERRRAWILAYWNIGLWSVGNGLAGSTLVIYLALQLGAPRIGLGISLILAARYLVGVLRLGAPLLIGRIADRKTFCLGTFLLSGILLFFLPMLAVPRHAALGRNFAQCAGDTLGLVPPDAIPGRNCPVFLAGRHCPAKDPRPFFWRSRTLAGGGRSRRRTSLRTVLILVDRNTSSYKMDRLCDSRRLGACFVIAAIVPLWKMPRAEPVSQISRQIDWKSIAKPFADSRFLRLLLFGCWFSFSNGLTQTVQFTYPERVLNISLLAMLAVQTGMRLGQLGVSPALGRMTDRMGNVPVMMFCLILTAQGPLFYFFSTPGQRWWFVGAYIVWIAYAGLNVALPNLMLKLSPGKSNTPYIAAYFTVTGLSYAAYTILGGWLFDRYGQSTFEFLGNTLDYNQWIFLIGWLARCLGILALLLIIEPRNNQVGERPT